jgi:cytoskeletal protein CcmA (bactofilin family)
MPTRHEIVCYECGYAFTATGRLDKVFCAKCRTQLVTGSVQIEGNWSEDVKTVGRVEIQPRAVVTKATVTGTDIYIAGDVTDAILKPTRRLELADGAKLSINALRGQQLQICEGAELRYDAPLHCADIEIAGTLRADLYPSGTVTIKPGGCLAGSLHTAHLVVEEGGGLLADIRVTKPTPAKQA